MQVADFMSLMNELAPLRLAETWDNVGLLLGDPAASAVRVLTCLTISPEVVEEALAEGVDLIIAHHPILFRGAKSIRADKPGHDLVWKLARHGVSVISHHTAWDSAKGGANWFIGNTLGLVDMKPMQPAAGPDCVKFVVFVPDPNLEQVRQAAFDAGAGQIGRYAECSFAGTGLGTFHGGEGTNPTIGLPGQRETAPEARLELITPKSLQQNVLQAIRKAHCYEEPAIDIYPLAGTAAVATDGVGRLGSLAQPESIEELAKTLASRLHSRAVQISLSATMPVQKVAIACGAGDDLVDLAIRQQADLLVTGELRYHTVLKAREAGLATILVGHHASERASMDYLAEVLQQKCPDVTIRASKLEQEPLFNL
jgi:dinuclear metal center YbgI/SA1388 family protein